MKSVVSGDGLLGTDIYDKLEGALALENTVLVTGCNRVFYLSIIAPVTISTGDIFATTGNS